MHWAWADEIDITPQNEIQPPPGFPEGGLVHWEATDDSELMPEKEPD